MAWSVTRGPPTGWRLEVHPRWRKRPTAHSPLSRPGQRQDLLGEIRLVRVLWDAWSTPDAGPASRVRPSEHLCGQQGESAVGWDGGNATLRSRRTGSGTTVNTRVAGARWLELSAGDLASPVVAVGRTGLRRSAGHRAGHALVSGPAVRARHVVRRAGELGREHHATIRGRVARVAVLVRAVLPPAGLRFSAHARAGGTRCGSVVDQKT